MYGIIYKVTNKINGKSYIGKTIRKLHSRKIDHISRSKRNNDNSYFHNALRKYGKKNFDWVILEECKSKEHLSEREQYWIIINKTHYKDGGYNLTDGGENNDTWSNNPNKEKMREKVSGKNHYLNKMTIEERNEFLDKHKRGENNPSVRFRGMTYEEMYGEETAKRVKEKRSITSKANIERWKKAGIKWYKEKKYIIKSKDGEEKIIEGLNKWCKENNIPRWAIYYSKKTNRPYKGWEFSLMKENEQEADNR